MADRDGSSTESSNDFDQIMQLIDEGVFEEEIFIDEEVEQIVDMVSFSVDWGCYPLFQGYACLRLC